MYSDEEESQEIPYVNYKQKYRDLKKHLHALIYENECFQEELRKAQRNFVSISKDRSFLLDRILKYEKPTGLTDSDLTESSDDEDDSKPNIVAFGQKKKEVKKKMDIFNGIDDTKSNMKPVLNKPMQVKSVPAPSSSNVNNNSNKKPRKPATARKPAGKKEKPMFGVSPFSVGIDKNYSLIENMPIHEKVIDSVNDIPDSIRYLQNNDSFMSLDGHSQQKHTTVMTREEVERHLEARRKISHELELNTTTTVPAELFSQENENDFDGSEVSDFVQLDDDGTSASMILQ